MTTYIIRRLIQGIFILMIITTVSFGLTRLSSDPMAQYTLGRVSAADRERIRKNLGLDQPLPVQYFRWLSLAVRGDFGYSITNRLPVSELIMQRIPQTLVLMVTAEVVIIVLSALLGIYSAVKQYSLFDNVLTGLSFIGFSLPIFFIALTLMFIFAVQFKVWGLPYLPTGADVWDFKDPYELVIHLILPVASLAIIQVAGYTRYLRSSMLEVLSQDYIRTARAKGLVERAVVVRHALRNAALPLVTLIGLDAPALLAGAIVTETVYSWPGMGRLFWQQAGRGDYPTVMAILLIVSTAVVFFQIVTDVAYTMIDPRIRLS
ncbi:MAG TPA: ABC transporter permease [Anaerolineales bacterium]|nr:ABC transporter permease [Anaerolineales bacterium]